MIKDWKMYQLDVKNVFLNGVLINEVYMLLSPGYEEDSKCCKIKEKIYELKQSPRPWFEILRDVMRRQIHTRE